jgi:hypothetical protein
MEPLAGYEKYLPGGQPAALHCKQSIYGLKQSPRLLHDRLSKHLKSLGYSQLISDKCVFVKRITGVTVPCTTPSGEHLTSQARPNRLQTPSLTTTKRLAQPRLPMPPHI